MTGLSFFDCSVLSFWWPQTFARFITVKARSLYESPNLVPRTVPFLQELLCHLVPSFREFGVDPYSICIDVLNRYYPFLHWPSVRPGPFSHCRVLTPPGSTLGTPLTDAAVQPPTPFFLVGSKDSFQRISVALPATLTYFLRGVRPFQQSSTTHPNCSGIPLDSLPFRRPLRSPDSVCTSWTFQHPDTARTVAFLSPQVGPS